MEHKIPQAKSEAITRAFLRVLGSAEKPEQALHAFDGPARRLIERRLSWLLYEPQIPFGGQKERWMVERFLRVARGGLREAYGWAEAFKSVIGYGYTRQDPRAAFGKEMKERVEMWRDAVKRCQEMEQPDRAWFYAECLKGMPSRVMNFSIVCRYLLEKADGSVDRLVDLENAEGERKNMVPLRAVDFASPEKFRAWALSQGNFSFGTGARAGVQELNKLQHDMGVSVAHKVVSQVTEIGWLPLPDTNRPKKHGFIKGLWFFRDVAFLPDGRVVHPDDQGITWHEDHGYQLGDQGKEGEFAQRGGPLMYGDGGEASVDEVRSLFVEATTRLNGAFGGGWEGGLMLGAILAYGASPEVFDRYACFPGLWVHGQQGSGKSKTCEWVMNVWGFATTQGLNLRDRNLSVVGMQMTLDQYSNVPVWFDEYRSGEVGADKLSVLQNCFNRGGGYKKIQAQRSVRTAPLVSGESTTSDAATRSRYMMLQMSGNRRRNFLGERRERENLIWFSEHCAGFYRLGRLVLQRRAEYVELFFRCLDTWMESAAMKDGENRTVEHRIRLVNGIGYAGFMAMVGLLESHGPEDITAFRSFMERHVVEGADEVQGEMNVNSFWTELNVAWTADAVPAALFKYKAVARDHPPDAPGQARPTRPWYSYTLYFDPEGVISSIKQHLVRQRDTMALGRSDYHAQMSRQDYWVPGKHRQRFGRGAATKACWAVSLDNHPMGYHAITDEEYQAWLNLSVEERENVGDPRKGPLYSIIEELQRKQNEEEEKE